MLGPPRRYKPKLRPQAQVVPDLCQRPKTAEVPTVPQHAGTKAQHMRTSIYKSTTTDYSRTQTVVQPQTRHYRWHTTYGDKLPAQQANYGRYT